jgi:hypothetical protein
MEQQEREPGSVYATSSAPGPNQVPPGGSGERPGETEEGARQSAGEWAEIVRRIEQQLRHDAARLVGSTEADDWGAIRDALVGRVKGQASELDRTEVGRRITDVGQTVEDRLRTGLAQAAGAGSDADWPAIVRTLRERVESALDPTKPAPPGGSGTGASVEDASVPAAPPSPDLGVKPRSAGGRDTGIPSGSEQASEDTSPSSRDLV